MIPKQLISVFTVTGVIFLVYLGIQRQGEIDKERAYRPGDNRTEGASAMLRLADKYDPRSDPRIRQMVADMEAGKPVDLELFAKRLREIQNDIKVLRELDRELRGITAAGAPASAAVSARPEPDPLYYAPEVVYRASEPEARSARPRTQAPRPPEATTVQAESGYLPSEPAIEFPAAPRPPAWSTHPQFKGYAPKSAFEAGGEERRLAVSELKKTMRAEYMRKHGQDAHFARLHREAGMKYPGEPPPTFEEFLAPQVAGMYGEELMPGIVADVVKENEGPFPNPKD